MSKLPLALFILFLFSFSISSFAATSSKAQLADWVAQVQKGPDSFDLRAKIIQLVLNMPKKPETPEEVDVLIGKAKAIMKDAKSPEDYKQAADVLHQALSLAPWLAEAYYDCGSAREKANDPLTAINDFKLYLLAKPHAKDRKSVMERIGSLEYAAEKLAKNTDSAAAINKLEGTWYARFCGVGSGNEKFNGGCNDADCYGTSWNQLSPNPGQPWPITFSFLADGTVKLDEYAAWALNGSAVQGDIYGVPNGPLLKDIRWEVRAKDGRVKQIYANLAEDTSYLTLSGDRPLAPSEYNKAVKYHYVFYSRKP